MTVMLNYRQWSVEDFPGSSLCWSELSCTVAKGFLGDGFFFVKTDKTLAHAKIYEGSTFYDFFPQDLVVKKAARKSWLFPKVLAFLLQIKICRRFFFYFGIKLKINFLGICFIPRRKKLVTSNSGEEGEQFDYQEEKNHLPLASRRLGTTWAPIW